MIGSGEATKGRLSLAEGFSPRGESAFSPAGDRVVVEGRCRLDHGKDRVLQILVSCYRNHEGLLVLGAAPLSPVRGARCRQQLQ
jgi:hypothetical protein